MATTEMGVIGEAARRSWAILLALLLGLTAAGAFVGRAQTQSYTATSTVRMQFPTSLQTVPGSDDFASWLRDPDTRATAAEKAGADVGAFSVTAEVPPANKRLVRVTATGPDKEKARTFLVALVDAGRTRAQSVVADQMAALTAEAKANDQALAFAEDVADQADALKARAGDDVVAAAAALQLAMQARGSRATLLGDKASLYATLTQLRRGVEVVSGPTVGTSIAGSGPAMGAIRGAIVGLAIVVVWLLWSTRLERKRARAGE
jgi:hypothetical protein